MAVEYTPAVLAELTARVRGNLARWGAAPDSPVRLLNVSENATFLVGDAGGAGIAGGRELVLRVHRVGYSSAAEIRSELDWIAALRAGGVIDSAAPLRGGDGEYVQLLAAAADFPARFAVAFERLPGAEPAPRDAVHWFGRLGAATARMHEHARAWAAPKGFVRKRWDFAAMVGPAGFWGPWRRGLGLDAAGTRVIERALEVIGGRLDSLGQGVEVFGLVHADLRLANLLVDGAQLRIIDFDDCGYSWFLYDFAAAVSFIEHEPQVPDLMRAWVTGYRRQHALSAEALAMLPTFVMLRRVLLTAWLASHAEVPLARAMGAEYTRGTVALAQEFLGGQFLQQ